MSKRTDEEYEPAEAKERFEKALRGGLKTSPKPLKDVPKNGAQKQKTPPKRG